MKRIIIHLLLFFCLAGIKPTLAQTKMSLVKMDSLARVLSQQKTTKDSILALQKLADLMPVRIPEALVYPDYVAILLELNKREKVIDPLPYELINKGNQYYLHKQYNESLIALQTAITEFDKQHKVIYSLLLGTRTLYNFLTDQEARLHYYQQKLEYYQVDGPFENIAPCYFAIGGYYNIVGAYNQAINNYFKAADGFRRYQPSVYANALTVIGSNYDSWGNEAKATYYLKKAQPLLKKAGNFYGLSFNYSVMSQLSYNEAQYTNALEEINEALSNIGNTSSQRLATFSANKAQIYLKMNQASLAIPILNRVKAMSDSLQLLTVNTYGDMELDYEFYEYYQHAGKTALAEKSLLQAYKTVVNEKGVHLQLKYLKELGDFYPKQNRPKLSGKYFDQYFKLADAREKGLDQYKVAQYEIDQNDKQQKEHISQLKQEKAVQDYKISHRNTLLWGALVVLLLISASLVFIYRQLQVNRGTLLSLRKTQRQLIQSEKMASLGEVTAGIAHEIQNPLNFVNNFSEVNTELITELEQEIDKGDLAKIKAIALDIKENEKKISQHGKRADFIVKGMLQHSRTSTGEKQPTNLNVLCDEFLRLSYHGIRAKDKLFNAELITHFDPALPKTDVVQQDIGRVMLNLFNNAFYAVHQKQKTQGPGYKPEVSVTTFLENEQVIIKIKDNGIGIPENIKEKIMQPFFTTKPTGEGTGLGLSLTYDMVVKGHGGNIEVNSVEGEGSEFIVHLPAATKSQNN